MTDPDFEIPLDRLPKKFAADLETDPTEPAHPRPAATVVLLRPSKRGPEVLLLRRNRTVGFVPGAFVFPGGRVDGSDGSEPVVRRLRGVTAEEAAERLGLPAGDPPAMAYYVAAVREAFEETGLLIGSVQAGELLRSATTEAALLGAQQGLTRNETTFPAILEDLDVILAGHALEYIAHWITPLVEPRRYDTRFFAASVPEDSEARPDGAEITAAVWLTPDEALLRNEAGRLPMVFPTIRTLQDLRGFDSVESLFRSFAGRRIPAILPRLVRTPTGIGIEIAEEMDPGV